MAYITKEEVLSIRKQLTTEFSKKEGWKFSVRKNHNSEVVVVILQAPYNLEAFLGEESYKTLNTYNGTHSNKGLPVSMFQDVQKIITIMKSQNWFDKSDSMTDYFHTAYYLDLKVGEWDKKFVSTGNNNEGQPTQKEKEDADFETLLNEKVAAREAQADRAEQDELIHQVEVQEDMAALEEIYQTLEDQDSLDSMIEFFNLEETFTAADIDRQEAQAHQEATKPQLLNILDQVESQLLAVLAKVENLKAVQVENQTLKEQLAALKAENKALRDQNKHLTAQQTALEAIQIENKALKVSIKNSTRLMEMAANSLNGKEDQPKPDQDPLENTKIFSISKGTWLKK